MYEINLISKYMENPTKVHLQATNKILNYLNKTHDFDFFYDRKFFVWLDLLTKIMQIILIVERAHLVIYIFLHILSDFMIF